MNGHVIGLVLTMLQWLAAVGGLAVFGIVAGAGEAAGGGAAEGEATGGDEGGAADAGAGEDVGPDGGDAGPDDERAAAAADGAAGPGDPDDDDEEDAGLPDDVRNNPTRLRTRLRRIMRQMREFRPVIDRLRGRDGKLVDVDDLAYRARQFDQMDDLLRRNPRLRQVVYGETGGDRGEERRPEGPAPFDPKSLPFELDTPEAQFFARQAQEVHELKQQVSTLVQRLERDGQTRAQADVAHHENTWKSATLAASNELKKLGPEGKAAARVFVEAMYGRFYRAQTGRQLGRIDPQQVIRELLVDFNLTKQQQQQAANASRQRIADNNRRQPAPVRAGAPAGAKPPANRDHETVSDRNKRFLAQHAG